MITKKLLPVLGISVAFLAACTDQVPEIPASELYTRAFVKDFGIIDGAQDWNNATRSSVNVSLPEQGDVLITTTIKGKNYLLARYKGISGTRRLHFDVPRGVTEVVVSYRDQRLRTALAADAIFERIAKDPTSEGGTGVTAELVTDPEKWMVVPMLNATLFRSKMPEHHYNIDRDGVTADFGLKFKTHDFILRPLYWQTSQTLEFGLFSFDADGKPVHYPIYSMERTGTWSPDLVLSYTLPETSSITIEDYAHNADFLACLAAQGVGLTEGINQYNSSLHGTIMDVSASDNCYTNCTSADDRAVTFACRAYLEKLGYVNDRDAAPDKRYNYVYRWHTIGDLVVDNTKDHGTGWCRDLEIVFTHFDSNFPEKAMAPGKDEETGPRITTQTGLRRFDEAGYPALVSKGIKVHLDDIDRTYGGYIKNSDGKYMYSMSSLNTSDLRIEPREGAIRVPMEPDMTLAYPESDFVVVDGKHARRAVTWSGTKYAWRYMSFEDGIVTDSYDRNKCDYDMQDFVFILDTDDVEYGDPTEEIITTDEPQPVRWLIACEDLGALDDFDFNDVVFEVQHVAGEPTARITPLAAGGTLETYLMRGDEIISGEWHALFGDVPVTQMINTTQITHTAKPFTIPVPEDFSISSSVDGDGYQKNMGDFHIMVVRPGGAKTTIITPPCAGAAPQMMLIFQPEGKPWRWPIERHHIKLAYPSFTDWMSGGSYEVVRDGANWFDSGVSSHTVAR